MLPSVKLVFLTMNTDPALAAEAPARSLSLRAEDLCRLGPDTCNPGGSEG
jgi:hypothetical protein